jgi:hypothetical protein
MLGVRIALLALLTLLPALAATQPATQLSRTVQPYVTVAEAVVAHTNVRVVDGTGAAPAENQTVVIRDGRIASVSAAGQPPPAGARVLDLGGHTVIPQGRARDLGARFLSGLRTLVDRRSSATCAARGCFSASSSSAIATRSSPPPPGRPISSTGSPRAASSSARTAPSRTC